MHQVLDAPGGDRVERRARLVHEDHVRRRGQRAGDAQALLLAARHAERVGLQPVLDLVPQGAAAQRALDDLVHVSVHSQDAGAERDVVVDRLGERVGLLEDHPDVLAHLDGVDVVGVEVLPVVLDLAGHLGGGDEVVHPVQAADERALAAARGADERGDLVLVDREVDLADGGHAAVGHAHVLELVDRLARATAEGLWPFASVWMVGAPSVSDVASSASSARSARSSRHSFSQL